MCNSRRNSTQLGERERQITFVEDDTGLQKKKNRLYENNCMDKCLYKWFLQECSEKMPINGAVLKAQAVQFNKLYGRTKTAVIWPVDKTLLCCCCELLCGIISSEFQIYNI
jgi:hypothetical protein